MPELKSRLVDFLWISWDVGKGGSGRYRCEQPAQLISKAGWSCYVGGLAGSAPNGLIYTLEGDPYHAVFGRVVILQRHAAQEAGANIAKARAQGQQVWVDADDLMPATPANNRGRWHDGGEGIRLWCGMLPSATGIVCSTRELADGLAKYNVRRLVVPNLIDWAPPRWMPQVIAPELRWLGWVGNTPVHVDNLQQLRGWLPDVLAQDDRLGVRWGGWLPEVETRDAFATTVGIPANRVEVRIAADINVGYPRLFEGIDLGLVPLASSKFSQAKTETKGLEMAAAGIPFLWSDHPSYKRTFGTAGRCRNQKDWREQIVRLRDPLQRANLACAQHESLRAQHSRAQDQWLGFARRLLPQMVAA